jgi:hypothetical protein
LFAVSLSKLLDSNLPCILANTDVWVLYVSWGAAHVLSLLPLLPVGLYEGNVRYRSKPEPKAVLASLQLLVGPHGQAAAVEAAAKGVALAQGTLTARWVTCQLFCNLAELRG